VEVMLHAILISELDKGEWPASHSEWYILKESVAGYEISRFPEVQMEIFHQPCHTRIYTATSGSRIKVYEFEIFYQVNKCKALTAN
jgi:hypothetical protein